MLPNQISLRSPEQLVTRSWWAAKSNFFVFPRVARPAKLEGCAPAQPLSLASNSFGACNAVAQEGNPPVLPNQISLRSPEQLVPRSWRVALPRNRSRLPRIVSVPATRLPRRATLQCCQIKFPCVPLSSLSRDVGGLRSRATVVAYLE